MSTKQLQSISPTTGAILYFIGLVLVYLYTAGEPAGSPAIVHTFFVILGGGVILIKFELQQYASAKVSLNGEAVYSFLALFLTVVGGYVTQYYPSTWYGGLILALIGAILAAYKDFGGVIPTVASPITSTTTK